MSYFEYTKRQLLELANAYEDYCSEIGQVYYNQEQEDIDRAWDRVEQVRKELGIPIEYFES